MRELLNLRRRGTAFALVVLGHALLMLLLLRLAPPVKPPTAPITVVELIAEPRERERQQEVKRQEVQPAVQPRPAPRPTPPAIELPYKLDIIELSPEEFARADIARLPSQPREGRAETSESASAAVETGPNGERLYPAEWYRQPTQQELAYYVPSNAPRPGWAVIACRTIANYRVDDCVPLGESHVGYGLADAIVQAAWQFRVWPPRLGGRAMVGEWVRIRIDFTREAAK